MTGRRMVRTWTMIGCSSAFLAALWLGAGAHGQATQAQPGSDEAAAAPAPPAPPATPPPAPPPAPTRPAERPPITAITVYPADPRSALGVHLLPPIWEQTSGNGASLYLSADLMLQGIPGESAEQLARWAGEPLKDLPLEAVQAEVARLASALRYAELGAHREKIEWGWPVREEGYHTVLPGLGPQRRLAAGLALQARLAAAQGQLPAALDRLQSGLSMSLHIQQGHTLMEYFTGLSCQTFLLQALTQVAQHPEAPSLYWALASLPPAQNRFRRAVEFEEVILELSWPDLRRLHLGTLTREQWGALLAGLSQLPGAAGKNGPTLEEQLAAPELVARAQQFLMERGWTQEQLDGKPPAMLGAIYQYACFQELRQQLFGYIELPFWLVQEPLEKSTALVQAAVHEGRGMPFVTTLPDLLQAYARVVMADRQLAAAITIEAIRLHAAGHEGKVPAALEDLHLYPAPMDPTTGRPFLYHVEQDRAVIESLPPLNGKAKDGLRLEVSVLALPQ